MTRRDAYEDEVPNQFRRAFLRAIIALPPAAVAGAVLAPLTYGMGEQITDQTGVSVGNAGTQEAVEVRCGPNPDPTCADEAEDAVVTVGGAVVRAPLLEEAVFRLGPAFISEFVAAVNNGNDPEDILRNLLTGTNERLTSRREVIIGALSTLVFGGAHNLTEKGVNTRVLPLPQLLGGAMLWVLQRKFGLASNVTAHAAFNVMYRHLHLK